LDEDFDVFGYHDGRYWIDMGTPQSFVRASRDLVMQPEISSATVITGKGFFADHNSTIDPSAVVGGGSAIAPGVKIGPKATVTGSIIGDNVEIGEGAEVIDSYIAAGLKIPPASSIQGQILAI
jgi:mannose-1-phosphate guanylyltransferase